MIGSTFTLLGLREIPFWYLFPNFLSYHQPASHRFLSTFSHFTKCHSRDAISYWSLKGAFVCVCMRVCRHVWAWAETLWNKMAAMNKEWVGFMNKSRQIACRLEWWTDRWTFASWDRELICTLYPFNPSVCGGKVPSQRVAGRRRQEGEYTRLLTQSTLLAGLSLTVCHQHHAEGSYCQQLC